MQPDSYDCLGIQASSTECHSNTLKQCLALTHDNTAHEQCNAPFAGADSLVLVHLQRPVVTGGCGQQEVSGPQTHAQILSHALLYLQLEAEPAERALQACHQDELHCWQCTAHLAVKGA